jgi:hypothetical protein
MWTSGFTTVLQLSLELINIVLAKFIQVLKAQNQHLFTASLGIFGRFEAELIELALVNIEDPPPVGGGVKTSAYSLGAFQLRLLGFISLNSRVRLDIENAFIELHYNTAGQPEAILLWADRSLKVKVSFPNASWVIRWLLNGVLAPAISFGLWLAFRLVQEVKVPIWKLVDSIGALGLRFAQDSPVLTAVQGPVGPTLLVASDFVQAGATPGNPQGLVSFLPAGNNAGAALHQRIAALAVDLAVAKGWLSRTFNAGGLKFKLNRLSIAFVPGEIKINGKLTGRGRKCWCRVKVKIYFNAGIRPRVEIAAGLPVLKFNYAANLNAQVSTSGMLAFLAVLLAGPLFLALALSLSFLANLLLSLLLPFKLTYQQQGLQLKATITGAQVGGLPPLHFFFALRLQGDGEFDLSPFTQFNLPNNISLNLAFSQNSLAVGQGEMLLAARAS